MVHLLETTMIRVGNETYAKENKSFGLTTLLNRHVKVDGSELKFHFKGKSGKNLASVRDRRIARTVKTCQELPGQHLFQYIDDVGESRSVNSADVNNYLKEASGAITAKDFRTWTGTVLMARFLRQSGAFESATQAKRALSAAVKQVAAGSGKHPGRLPQVLYSPGRLKRLSRGRACPRGRRACERLVGADRAPAGGSGSAGAAERRTIGRRCRRAEMPGS